MSTNCEKKSAFDHTQHNLTISLKKAHPIGIFFNSFNGVGIG
jgi:hypothetical protein